MMVTMVNNFFALCFAFSLFLASPGTTSSVLAAETENTQHLLLWYDFADVEQNRLRDLSEYGSRIDVKIDRPKSVQLGNGSLKIERDTILNALEHSEVVSAAIKRSGELTIDLWITPADLKLKGPARILTISKNSSERNLTVGQDQDRFEVRLRTTKTSGNGIPALSSNKKSVKKEKTHLVYTRSRDGSARLFVNGKLNQVERIAGDLSNWNPSFQLALGNELTKDRPWLGTYHRVAIYNKAMTGGQVMASYRAGDSAAPYQFPQVAKKSPQEELFEAKVASILVKRCFECHDAATREGGLNLATKVKAFQGGESGVAIVPGNAEKSLLWDSIANDDMPADRPPLSKAEKKVIRDWIDQGAVWTFEQIDPEVYEHDEKVAESYVRRLTVPEYIETVRVSLGVDISKEAREILPADMRADGFSNTAYNLNVDLKHVNSYARLAEMIVEKLDVDQFAKRFTRKRRLIDDDMRDLVSKMGKWLLRGPLTEDEIVIYRGISTTVASAGGDYQEAVAYTIQAMLQSPRFLYRIENQRGDGSAVPVNAYELASRMSYLLWGGPPDQALFDAAERGELYDLESVKQQVERMLADPRAEQQSIRFVDEWLDLYRLDNLRPNKEMFPRWDQRLAEDMREETRAYFKDVVWTQDRPLADLLNAQTTFLTPGLAQHYGIEKSVQGRQKVDVSDLSSRGGLLTQGSVLTVGGDEASMVSRGLFVLHDLLRSSVKDPPPCVDTTPIPTKPGRTQRAIAMERLANGSCGGCHSKFEPLAFGLERFDGLGSYHEVDEHGNELREDGEILFPGDEEAVKYQTSAELMDLLAESDRVSECLTWKVVQFSLGRPLVPADIPIVKSIHQASLEKRGTWSSLMTEIVLSDFVQTTRTEEVP